MHWETIWTFNTENFQITLDVAPCELPPEDTFYFDEDIDMVRNGEVEYFDALVTVKTRGYTVGEDHLGACAYRDIREFYTSHRDKDAMNRNCSVMRAERGENVCICHYFPDMVRQAIAEARKTMSYRCHRQH